ncbi:HNH endonuclease [Hymenobacter sp. YC55]|uniref:HNH endonuclease n=1 Tax=Hymenobacter sp. YC55 TaxID=3034019 RepID=UPI0023F95B4D|nr:HNH endonuclease [Hymenobacter sp. YC55]MDF7810440.1 HNH endonuclease [Hymenobacter sp. YC55]
MRRRSIYNSQSELIAPIASVSGNCCALCEREVQQLSRHHLIPREEGGRHGPTADLCQPCHSSVHLLLDNKELARQYHTIEALRGAEKLQKYLHWIRRSRVERISNRRGNK